ncbi:MAG: cadmium-translocating P-type ATPase [Eubacterium sp.]|nr:cadmium-translocating P-type ATPase [Eubacterium sp.]
MEKEHKHNHGSKCSCCEHEHNHGHEHHHHDDGCGCGHNHEHGGEVNKGEFAFKVICGGILLVIGYILEEFTDINSYIPLICFAISYLIVGFNIIKEAVEGVIHGNIFNENLLMGIASIGAFAIGEYIEGCAVVLLYTIGEFLQDLAVGKSRKSISDMIEMKPQSVTVIRNGKNVEVKPEDVKVGEEFIVNPGQKIDLDGVIVKGNAEVDMAALTGESVPVSMMPGSEVLSGSVNLDGMLIIKATKPYSESTVSRILAMIEDSNGKKSNAEKFISRFARIYTPIVCLIALLIIVVPPLFFHGEWSEWIYRGLSALVVSCPCAIVISIPLGFFSGLGACSKQGILIKGSNYLEMLSKCNVGVFDKTGTITSGKFEYVNCECVHCHCENTVDHRELLALIAACEKYSTHPIAKSVSLAFGHYADELDVTDAKNYAGMGVSAIINGKKYYAGNEKLMTQVGVDFKETALIGTAIYLCSDEEFLGDIVFADVIKADSKDALAEMKKMGITKTVMLTGDKEPIAKDIAEKAGIDVYYSKLLPDEKVERVRELKKDNNDLVLYTGDGINDAPVLAEADLGVAMGGIGSDVAIEAADVVIMGDSLSKIPLGRKIAKKTMHIVNENIIFSIGVKVLIIIGCAVGIFDENAMWLAVFGDVGVCLIAVANSLRALYFRNKSKK